MNGMNTSNRGWTRRGFLRGSTAAMAAAYGLRPAHTLAAIPNEFDGSKFQLAAPEPNPKRGGVLRVGILNRLPHFDFQQSGTVGSIGSQGCMYDNLIRHDPRDSGKTIIPDLAHSWDISKDGTTYTFLLRKGVQFHDGAELTSADVKATFDRIVKPPAGVSIPRSILFKSVSEIVTPDKYSVQFKLAAPRPASFVMAAIASGWNGILRKQTLEENGYNLRKVSNIPGTGPYRSLRRVENEVWVMERNKDYWNKGLPYLDGIEFYNLIPFSPELGAAILSNRVDYARIVDPVTARKAKATPGMSTTAFNQSVIQGTWTNDKKKPFDDPRVRRAFHLALDRHVLVDVTKDVAPMRVGGFMYPFSEFATPTDQLFKRVGYQEDPTAAIKEAKALMAAAGYANGIKGLDFMVRDIASFKLWAQAIQAMLQQNIDVQCNLRTVVEVGLVRRCVERTFRSGDRRDRLHAAGSVGLLQCLVSHRRPAELLVLEQPEVRCPGRSDRRGVRPGKRQALIRQTEEIMEQDPPVLPICWEQINDVWWNYVKGYNPYDYFGVYDVVREDIFWLDKA